MPYWLLRSCRWLSSLIDVQTLKRSAALWQTRCVAFGVALRCVIVWAKYWLGAQVCFPYTTVYKTNTRISRVGQIGDTGHFSRMLHAIQGDPVCSCWSTIDEKSCFRSVRATVYWNRRRSGADIHRQNLHDVVGGQSYRFDGTRYAHQFKPKFGSSNYRPTFFGVKGPVMDVIEKTDVIQKLTGKGIFKYATSG